MTTTPLRPTAEVARVRKLRERALAAQLDWIRAATEAVVAKKVTQTELSRALGVAQPSISELVNRARKADPVPEGFSGASPYEIAQRFDADLISREELVDELSRWHYTPDSHTDGYDSLLVDQPGSFAEVTKAFTNGLIDAATYDEIIDRAEERSI